MGELQAELQRVSGTTLDAQGAANAWAGTTGLDLVRALNTKAGSGGLELLGVMCRLVGSARGSTDPAFLTTVSPNLLTANQASLETDATGWAVETNATVARSIVQALDGVASLSITALALGLSAARTPVGASGVPVVAGRSYTARASFRAATTGRAVQVAINWYTSAGGAIGSVSGGATDAATGWTVATASGVAPATAAYGSLVVTINDATQLGTEVHFVDRISLAET